MVPKGEYTFKVVNTQINVMRSKTKNAGKKYLYLTVEIQDEGPHKGERMWVSMAPWSDFNWLNNIKSFFSPSDIETYMLEERDEDTLWVVSQLILGEVAKGTVKHGVGFHDRVEYASVMMRGSYDGPKDLGV